MNVEELRIGNYVHNNVESFPIKAKDLMFLLSFDNDHYAEPIPINEDWLLAFGYSIEAKLGFYHDGSGNNIFIDLKNKYVRMAFGSFETGTIFPIIATSIEYIHQLQNLFFYLTGKELSAHGSRNT